MDDDVEVGGVSTCGDATYWWIEDHGFIDCAFDTGHNLMFTNDREGWSLFLAYAIVLGGLV